MRIAIVPSCNTFEAHFTGLGVSPADLADGRYRGTWITHYAAALRGLGHDVDLVVPSRETGTTVGSVMRVVRVDAPRFYGAVPERVWRWKIRPLGSYWSSLTLRAALESYDVCYLQEYSYGRMAALARVVPKLPIVAAHHGTSIADAPWWVRKSLRHPKVLTTLTQQEFEAVKAYTGPRGLREPVVVRNWVEEVWFSEPLIDEVAGRMVWVGRIEVANKGLITLVEAFAQSLREDDRGQTLEIIGGGPDAGRLMAHVDGDTILRDRVFFGGRVDDVNELCQRVMTAEVFVNSSVVEGFPLAVIEAMACGRKTLLTRLPYVDSELDGAPGLFTADVGSVNSIAAAMKRALAAPATHDAREWARSRFSASASVASLEAVLRAAEGETSS